MTETETKWWERVKEWKASGQTAKAFAQGRDFKPSTLTYWAYRVRQIAERPAWLATKEPATSATPQVRMVRVRPTRMRRASPTQGTEAGASATVVIAIGAARVEVRSGFDRVLLAQVVEALGGAR
jgi:hypothetical protein